MTSARQQRQDAIRDVVREQQIRTQTELAMSLKAHGYDVTQATVSRDMAELGLEKDGSGVYILPEDYRLRSIVQSVVNETRRAGNQVIVLSDPGTAGSVAAALDASQMHGVLGSIAGDDTILVICADEEQGEHFQSTIDGLLAYGK